MSFKPSQIIIAGVAGILTSVIVAYATVQSRSSPPTPERTPISSPAVSPSPSPSPVSVAPANIVAVSPSPLTRPVVIKPPVEGCRINTAVVNDPNPPLNVRSSPEVKAGNIVGQLNNNTFVPVVEEKNGWLKISDPVEGWIAKNRTRSSCAIVNKPIQFLPGGNSALVQGEMIGGGSHTYTIRAKAGQTLTVENYKSVFPLIISPNGKLLTENEAVTPNTRDWSGQLPVTGEYSLQLDSNYKGFEYEFLVRIN